MDSPWKNEKLPISNFPIYSSSEKAINKIKDPSLIGTGETEQLHTDSKYPFRVLKIGQSFSAACSVTTRENLSTCGKSYGNKKGKKFTVIYWPEYDVFEVARIA